MCASSGLARTFLILKLYVDEVIVLIHVECLKKNTKDEKTWGDPLFSMNSSIKR